MIATSAREEILGDIRRALETEVTSAPSPAETVAAQRRQLDQPVFAIKKDCEQRRDDLIEQFATELLAVGGRFYAAPTGEAAFQYVEQLASDRRAKTIIGWDTQLIDGIDLTERLGATGISFLTERTDREFMRTAVEADIGVSAIDYALAETGTLVLVARKGQARSVSLLPPIHIAVMKPEQVIPGLCELFPLLRGETEAGGRVLTSAITFITGPSRTADIELTLVVGVHGPQQLHVVLVES
ncbi:MAG: lactate utilization protein [Acidobacteriota bacterium]